MNFMDLKLSAPQLEGMYRNVLVDLVAPGMEAMVAKEKLKFLGNNLRNVTVLVESPNASTRRERKWADP